VTRQELLRVRADFNEVDEDNRLHVLPRQADRPDSLVVGARVLLRDDEGSTMLGDVVERTERLAAIQVLPYTWRNPLAPVDPASTLTGTVTTTVTFTASPDARFWLLGGRGQVIILLLPYAHRYWWEPAVHSVSSTAPATAEPATAGR
jgi:hypothetical protein